MLSFDVIIFHGQQMLSFLCYHFPLYICCVIIWCYNFSRSANVIIFMLSFSLVHILCYHLCYHLMLSFIVITSPLFSFSWKRDTLALSLNRRKNAAWNLSDLVWLYRSPFPVKGEGGILLVQTISTCRHVLSPHQNDQGRKGPCYFQRLNALKCLKCQKIKKNI